MLGEREKYFLYLLDDAYNTLSNKNNGTSINGYSIEELEFIEYDSIKEYLCFESDEILSKKNIPSSVRQRNTGT